MPVLNWVALKPSQINGTVFNDIDDESILQVLHNLTCFMSFGLSDISKALLQHLYVFDKVLNRPPLWSTS